MCRSFIHSFIFCGCGHLSALLSLPSKPLLWLLLWEGQGLLSLLWAPSLWKGGNLQFTYFSADSNGKPGLGTTRLDHLQAFCLIYICASMQKVLIPILQQEAETWKKRGNGILSSPSYTDNGSPTFLGGWVGLCMSWPVSSSCEASQDSLHHEGSWLHTDGAKSGLG